MNRRYQYFKNYPLLTNPNNYNIVKTFVLNNNRNKYSIGKKSKFTKGVYKGYVISSKKI